MSHTIYGDYPMNGYYVSDMVDDSRDYVYYKNETERNYFLRLTGVYMDETMDEFIGPGLALFLKDKPFDPVYVERLAGSFKEYDENPDKLGCAVDNIYEKLENNKAPEICILASKLKDDNVADLVTCPSFDACDNQGYTMSGSYVYEGKEHHAYVVLVDSQYSLEYQLASQILEENNNNNSQKGKE